MGLHHLIDEVESTITGGFRTDVGASPLHAFARQYAFPVAGQLLVHAEEVADFTSADADVARRNVDVRADMTIEFAHERLAEAHDLGTAAAAWRKIAASLAATHGQRGQRILESLLETEELHNAQVDRRVETQTALVRADGAVELHAIAYIDMNFALVVGPRHTEHDDTLRFDDTFDDLCFLKFRMLVVHILDGMKHFFYCLKEFRLSWMLLSQVLHDFFYFHSVLNYTRY